MTDKIVGKIECPICGTVAEMVLSKDATINSLNDMNWKQKLNDIIHKYSKKIVPSNMVLREIILELEL